MAPPVMTTTMAAPTVSMGHPAPMVTNPVINCNLKRTICKPAPAPIEVHVEVPRHEERVHERTVELPAEERVEQVHREVEVPQYLEPEVIVNRVEVPVYKYLPAPPAEVIRKEVQVYVDGPEIAPEVITQQVERIYYNEPEVIQVTLPPKVITYEQEPDIIQVQQ